MTTAEKFVGEKNKDHYGGSYIQNSECIYFGENPDSRDLWIFRDGSAAVHGMSYTAFKNLDELLEYLKR